MKKRLMIIVPNLQGGGQERIAALTSQILVQDYSITFVVFDNTDSKYEVAEDAEFVNLGVSSSQGWMRKLFNVIIRSVKVEKIKRTRKIDYSMSFGRSANIVNCLSGKGAKKIVSIRNSSFKETGCRSIINNLIFKSSDAVVCVSKGIKERIISKYPEIESKTFVIYNPCDVERISKVCIEEKSEEINPHVISACGRLEKVKCYKNLFNAVKIAREKIEDIKLIVFGEGTQRKELEEYIDACEMNEYIELAGFKNEPFKYVAKSDLFVLSSAREGFPNVLIEALASGTPIISTDCEYGPREILTDGAYEEKSIDYELTSYGILTPAFKEGVVNQVFEERALAEAIVYALKNPEEIGIVKENGKQRAKCFSTEMYRLKIAEMLDAVRYIRKRENRL